MPKYKIIANPMAGGGTARHKIPLIQEKLTRLGLDFDLVRTDHIGHSQELTRQAVASGYDIIVAAGGDGTSNDVVNGLMEARQAGLANATMGVLCIGRGNDFAGSIGIPYDLDQACDLLRHLDQRRMVDIGRVTGGVYPQGRYFCNCVGIGFDAIGTIEVSKLPRMGGFFSFFIAVLKTIFLYYKAPLTKIEYDGQTLTQPSLMVSIMNGRRLGGGFIMAPNSEPDDGFFDLCIAEEMSRVRIFQLIPHFLKGTQATQKEIKTARATHIQITALEGSKLPAQTDGEILCIDGQNLEVELLPRQIEVICPIRKGKQ